MEETDEQIVEGIPRAGRDKSRFELWKHDEFEAGGAKVKSARKQRTGADR